MEHTRKLRTWGGFLLLLVLLVTFLIWNLLAGSVRLPASEIWAILHGGGDLTQRRILLNIRLPRLLAAMILGGALSVSGFLLQTFFHNPIAGPFVLGISSGAKFTVAVTMILLLSRGVTSSSAALIAAAFVGAMLSMGFVLLISRRVRRMSLLVVCGVMIGYICSALTDFLVTFADDSNPRLLLRHELGQCPHDGRGLRRGPDPDVPALQAPPGLSAGRGLRAESRRAAARVPCGADLTFQCALRLRHGLCRPDLLRRHRRAAPDEVPF